MTDTGPGDDRLTTSERREVAREKAKELRLAQKKLDRRNRWLLQGGLAVVAVAIIATVTLIIVNSVRPAAPGPRNMLSDGIKIGQNFEAVQTVGLAADKSPVPSTKNTDDVIDIRLYIDYNCKFCAEFEAENNEQIAAWISEGAATVEIHPISLLDGESAATQYSTRAANAAACVANYSPNSFFDVNAALFAEQPGEGEPGLNDAALFDVIRGADVSNANAIEKCIHDQQFRPWVKDATARALNGPIPDSEVDKVRGAPTILVNGAKYNYSRPFEAQEFGQVVSQAAGSVFNKKSTETPAPVPTP
ncbi:thioredoxin domain-containing protein [Diaminobutyricimonas sp. LJ205]|uniref:DsbA family protein n=1 Tax=Diaminobutyricimonas sp. LJ205 TaxID=2683590 RepID=UPI0012F4AB07|nr:thioredoxin domain-containing protein [Diaminobutyricimonas sp. LJ205]